VSLMRELGLSVDQSALTPKEDPYQEEDKNAA